MSSGRGPTSQSQPDPSADDPPERRPPFGRVRAHVDRRRASRSFEYVLLLVVASFVFAATAPDAAWATSVLVLVQSANLVVALWTSGLSRAGAWYNVLFLALAVALATAGLVWTGSDLATALGLISALMTIAIVVVIALTVVHRGEVNRQSITGAICVYLLLGMIFMFVYGIVATLGDGPFFLQGTDGTRALRTYFSYVTLATLGYGDYTPAGNLGHTLAIFEALFGQLYLVTVVALLVARVRPGRARED